MVVAEVPPWVALAVIAMAVALGSTALLAARRQSELPWLSWLAFAFLVGIVVFMLGLVGVSWARAFLLAPGSG